MEKYFQFQMYTSTNSQASASLESMLAQVGDDKVSHVTGTALSAEQWWIEAEIQASLSDTTQGSSVEQSVQALVNRLRVMTGPDRSLAALVTLLTRYGRIPSIEHVPRTH
jgi:hypothetical protein